MFLLQPLTLALPKRGWEQGPRNLLKKNIKEQVAGPASTALIHSDQDRKAGACWCGSVSRVLAYKVLGLIPRKA